MPPQPKWVVSSRLPTEPGNYWVKVGTREMMVCVLDDGVTVEFFGRCWATPLASLTIDAYCGPLSPP